MVKRVWRPRVWLYGVLFLLVVTLLVGGLSTRKGFAVDIIKDRGTMARELGNGDIENIYRLKVMNTTERTQTYTASVQGLPGLTLATNPVLSVPATGIGALTIRLTLAADTAQTYRGKASPISFRVEASDQGKAVAVEEKSTFVIPR
jgi:polyferredoxin